MQVARTRLVGALLAAALVSGAPGLASADECTAEATALTSLGQVIHDSREIVPGKLARVGYGEPNEKVRYVRLLLRHAEAHGKWQVIVRDPKLRIIDTLTDEHVTSNTGVWTRRLYGGGELYLDLRADSPSTRIEIARAVVMLEQPSVTYYSLQDPGLPSFSPLYEAPTEIRRIGDHVGLLMSSFGTKSWCCSGVAVGEDLFLTNWHCGGDARSVDAASKALIWSKEVCESTFIDFSWDGDGVDREFTCVDVIDKDEQNDFALLKVRPLRGADRLQPATLRQAPPRGDEPIRMVHHPACKLKQLSRSCSTRDVNVPGWRDGAKSDFTHRCDSEGGSSGAPIFDESNRLIGIHHLGFERKGGVCDTLNKGVGIDRILNSMKPANAGRLRLLMRD